MHGKSEAVQRLPRRDRGRDGPASAVHGIPLRVSVMGVDGTFELTRMVHDALVARRRRVFAQAGLPLAPQRHAFRLRQAASDRRLLRHLQRAARVDALVLEAPAAGEDGLRFNRDVAQAQTVLLTAVARDPRHGARSPDPARAEEAAAALPPLATLVSGEPDPGMKEALRVAVRAAGGFFVDAAPRAPDAPPGLELVTVLDRFLRIRTGGGLASAEKVRLLSRMERRLQWAPSALPGVRWHDGASVSPTFLRSAIDHLLHRWPTRIHVLAYYGADKARDGERLVPVLRRAFADGVVARAYVAGAGSRPLVRALGSSHAVSVVAPTTSALPGLLRILRSECHAGALVAAGDGGAPWMRAATAKLRLPGLPRGAWAPFGAHASDLPASIAVPPPPAGKAPGIGRRSRANILGDPDPPAPPPRQVRGWRAPG